MRQATCWSLAISWGKRSARLAASSRCISAEVWVQSTVWLGSNELMAQRRRQMTFPDAWRAHRDHIVRVGDKCSAAQALDFQLHRRREPLPLKGAKDLLTGQFGLRGL